MSHQDLRFTTWIPSFAKPPPMLGVKKIRWSKNPSNRLGTIPKRLPQGDFHMVDINYPLQLPTKLEVTKIVVGKLIKFISNDPKAHLYKPF